MRPPSEFVAREAETRHWDDIGYTAVLQAEDKCADSIAYFKVYGIVKTDATLRAYKKDTWDTTFTPNFKDTDEFLSGDITWDGCSNWHFGNPVCLHFCEREQAMALGALLGRLYDWGREIGMDRDRACQNTPSNPPERV